MEPLTSGTTAAQSPAGLARVLKRSEFVVGLVRARRGLSTDLRTLRGLIRRRRQIAKYLNTHELKKLHVGASDTILDGWLNTDASPSRGSVVYMDATQQFPFDNDTFDYIMAEQMIEHIEYEEAQMMLRECFRVLRAGGRVRFATPDLEGVLALYRAQKSNGTGTYTERHAGRFLPEVRECRDVFVINHMFHAWGHRFLYDRETLRQALCAAGFGELSFHRQGESEDPVLRNVESHGRKAGFEDMSRFITTVVEGRKPERFRPLDHSHGYPDETACVKGAARSNGAKLGGVQARRKERDARF